jgi:hypothetical protein
MYASEHFFSEGSGADMPTNGEINQAFGVYRNICCGVEIVIQAGATFPDCPNHPKLTTKWKGIADEPIRHVRDLPTKEKKSDSAA